MLHWTVPISLKYVWIFFDSLKCFNHLFINVILSSTYSTTHVAFTHKELFKIFYSSCFSLLQQWFALHTYIHSCVKLLDNTYCVFSNVCRDLSKFYITSVPLLHELSLCSSLAYISDQSCSTRHTVWTHKSTEAFTLFAHPSFIAVVFNTSVLYVSALNLFGKILFVD